MNNIVWLTWDDRHVEWFGNALDIPIQTLDFSAEPQQAKDADALILCADSLKQGQVDEGLNWLQQFRLKTDSLAPVLVYSFRSRDRLSQKFTLLAEDKAGIKFVRLPVKSDALKAIFNQLKPLTEAQLKILRRRDCQLDSKWRKYVHDLGHCVTTVEIWQDKQAEAKALLEDLGNSIQEFAEDQLGNLGELQQAFVALENADGEPEPYLDQIKRKIGDLEDGLYG